VQEVRSGLTQEALNEIVESYGWRLAAEHYSTTEGGKTLQFEPVKR
jgi:hypothetical protein